MRWPNISTSDRPAEFFQRYRLGIVDLLASSVDLPSLDRQRPLSKVAGSDILIREVSRSINPSLTVQGLRDVDFQRIARCFPWPTSNRMTRLSAPTSNLSPFVDVIRIVLHRNADIAHATL